MPVAVPGNARPRPPCGSLGRGDREVAAPVTVHVEQLAGVAERVAASATPARPPSSVEDCEPVRSPRPRADAGSANEPVSVFPPKSSPEDAERDLRLAVARDVGDGAQLQRCHRLPERP